jgi:hypothetical protein
MGHDADAMFDVIEGQNGLGKAEDGQGNIELILWGNRQALEASYRIVREVANRAAIKLRQLVLCHTRRSQQAILTKLGLDQCQRIMTGQLFGPGGIGVRSAAFILYSMQKRHLLIAVNHYHVWIYTDKRIASDVLAAHNALQQKAVRGQSSLTVSRNGGLHIGQNVAIER